MATETPTPPAPAPAAAEPKPIPLTQRDLPFDGLRITRPKRPTDYKWAAILGFGMRRLGGVGDTPEEAAVALLDQVLSSTEEMFTRALQYRLIEPKVLERVRRLTAKFAQEVRQLHAVVLSDAALDALLADELPPAPAKGSTSLKIDEEELDEDALL